MEITNKNILVIGLGISGVSTIKALHKLGANITVTDSKREEELKDVIQALEAIPLTKLLGSNEVDLEDIDLIVKSPGVSPTIPLIQDAISRGIEVISDIELAYRLDLNQNFIAITGTNGKTTTTSLVGEIFKDAGFKTHVVGNIGRAILGELVDSAKEDIFVIEASSFQLEHTRYFKPKVGLILNLAPDHLDWHGSFEAYVNAKKKIFKNQDEDDFLVLNFADDLLRSCKDEAGSKIIWFSTTERLAEGIYIDGEDIVISYDGRQNRLMSLKEVKLPGRHNLENTLAAIGIALALGLDLERVRKTISNFKGVEHRLEYVGNKKGISFYNDSKGTNPDASIKAIEAIPAPIILIAGGFDKGTDFGPFIRSFNGKVKALILLGQTKYKIKECADIHNFKDYHLVDSLEEGVQLAYKLAERGDNILLSPACASWGMFKDFEERGNAFKAAVHSLREE